MVSGQLRKIQFRTHMYFFNTVDLHTVTGWRLVIPVPKVQLWGVLQWNWDVNNSDTHQSDKINANNLLFTNTKHTYQWICPICYCMSLKKLMAQWSAAHIVRTWRSSVACTYNCVCQEIHTYTTTNLIELFSQEHAQDMSNMLLHVTEKVNGTMVGCTHCMYMEK
jgi:hypothetical protein